jgi:hypothetical protein
MAAKVCVNIECPHCGERFDADFWSVVRGDLDQEVKDLIISGEFDLLGCPKCSAVFTHEEPFLYLDPQFELLVFVMPETYRPQKDKWLAKMKADHAALVASGLGGLLEGREPEYFFGVGELSARLARDRDMEEESEVLSFIAAENNIKTARLRSQAARDADLPFCLPYSGTSPSKTTALAAVRKIISINDALPRLKNLRISLEALGSEEIPFVK